MKTNSRQNGRAADQFLFVELIVFACSLVSRLTPAKEIRAFAQAITFADSSGCRWTFRCASVGGRAAAPVSCCVCCVESSVVELFEIIVDMATCNLCETTACRDQSRCSYRYKCYHYDRVFTLVVRSFHTTHACSLHRMQAAFRTACSQLFKPDAGISGHGVDAWIYR